MKEASRKVLIGETQIENAFRFSSEFIDTYGEQTKLYYRRFTPIEETVPKKASLVIYHGFGEHTEVYINFAV